MSEKKQCTLRLDPTVYKKLKIISDVKGTSVNEYINSIILKDINNVDLSDAVSVDEENCIGDFQCSCKES